ncbi:hypothetical protein BAAM0499_05250 [Bifidobacterium animalis subsp. animalis MCC 0499]|nr:hypothetical protein BAAM0499_05250 [Bifidobacterium animalis subsp. animalis MCC 0499]
MQISFGRLINAHANASICCSPPDIVPACCDLRSARRGNRSYIRSRSSATPALSVRV